MKNILLEPFVIMFVIISYKIFILGEHGGYIFIGWLLLLIIISLYIMFSAKVRKERRSKNTKNKIRSADELTVSVSFGILGFLYVLTAKMDVIGNIVIGLIIGLSLIRVIFHMYFRGDESEKASLKVREGE